MDWKCPLCGSDSYSEYETPFWACDGCSVVFTDPEKFNHKKMIEEVWT